MSRTPFLPAIFALMLAGTVSHAVAGGVAQVAQFGGVPAKAAQSAAAPVVVYAPSGGATASSTSGGLSGPDTTTSYSTANGLNVQTSIDASKNVNGTANVSIDETINGVNWAYGLNGASVLNVINGAVASTADTISQRQNADQQVEDEALYIAQLQQQQQPQQAPQQPQQVQQAPDY